MGQYGLMGIGTLLIYDFIFGTDVAVLVFLLLQQKLRYLIKVYYESKEKIN